MFRSLRKLLLAAPFAATLAAQGQPESNAPARGGRASAKDAKVARTRPPAGLSDADATPALANFAGGRITARDMEAAIANKAPLVRAEIATPEGRTRFLRDLVRWDLLVLEAERRGYATHPRVIDGGDLAAIDAMQAHDLAVEPNAISKQDVERYFSRWRTQRARPVVRRAAHIQVATEAEARTLLAELADADDARFAMAAVKRSADARTRDQGGEIGFVTRDGRNAEGHPVAGVPREIFLAVFEAPRPGALAPRPVRHAGGFSVVRCGAELPAREPRLAEVEAKLREEIARARQVEALDALVTALRAELKPVVRAELVDRVLVDTRAPDIPAGFPAAPPDPRAPTIFVPPDDM